MRRSRRPTQWSPTICSAAHGEWEMERPDQRCGTRRGALTQHSARRKTKPITLAELAELALGTFGPVFRFAEDHLRHRAHNASDGLESVMRCAQRIYDAATGRDPEYVRLLDEMRTQILEG